MDKKTPVPVIDSRHLKILAAKKDQLKDAVVFVWLDDNKYGYYDIAQLRTLAEGLDKIEPSGCYFVGMKSLRVNIFDLAEVKNRDLVITVDSPDLSKDDIEDSFKEAFGAARSLTFVHKYASDIEIR